jgi:hypothetical protein
MPHHETVDTVHHLVEVLTLEIQRLVAHGPASQVHGAQEDFLHRHGGLDLDQRLVALAGIIRGAHGSIQKVKKRGIIIQNREDVPGLDQAAT